jgi:hypothetical protein
MKPISKKYLTLFIFTFFVLGVSAQIEKGNRVIGGSAGFEHLTNGTNYNISQFTINGMYGVLLTDHILLGGRGAILYQYSGTRRGNLSLKAGPLMRYYFNNSFFIQADYSLESAGRMAIQQDVYGRLGRAFFLNESVALEPYIYFGYINTSYGGRGARNSQSYFDYGVYFSLQIYLQSAFNKTKHILKVRAKPAIK